MKTIIEQIPKLMTREVKEMFQALNAILKKKILTGYKTLKSLTNFTREKKSLISPANNGSA